MSKCTIIIPLSLTSVFAQDMRASALDCTAVSQIFEQSLTARGKHSLSRIWLRRWKTDSWIRPLFSQTLELSLGKNSLKSWLEEFSRLGGLVSPLVAQANAKQPRMNAGSSTSLQMELPLCGPVFFSPKTSKGFYQQKCQTALPFLATASRDWKAYITELRQAYSARLNAAHRTNASGCSSWPTISVNESKNSVGGSQMDRKSIPLGTMAAMHGLAGPMSWPTPQAQDTNRSPEAYAAAKEKHGSALQQSLNNAVHQHGPAVPASSSTDGNLPESWPTPNSQPAQRKLINGKNQSTKTGQIYGTSIAQAVQQWQTATVSTGANRQKDGSMTDKLDQQVKNWATARSGMARGSKFTYDRGKGNIEEQAGASVRGGGKLNPRWVETLMGLPVGWTMPSCASPVTIERMNSDSSVTVLSQQQQNELSGS